MTSYKSKHGTVSKSPAELFMQFADMRNFANLIPEDKKQQVSLEADYDRLKANVQGFNIGVKVLRRTPYSLLEFEDDGAPLKFNIALHFDPMGGSGKTDFSIDVDADLNFMMKMMIGNKIQDALDKIVDGLVAMSEGRMPEGIDPSMFK